MSALHREDPLARRIRLPTLPQEKNLADGWRTIPLSGLPHKNIRYSRDSVPSKQDTAAVVVPRYVVDDEPKNGH